jgi:phosphatidylserine decarboxylase
MSKPLPLPVWDRKNGTLFRDFMDDSPSTYESTPHRSAMQWLQSHPAYDWLLAAYQNTGFSARKIEPFIRKHGIDMSDFEAVEYHSYAEFFERRLRPGRRSFPAAPDEMGAFAEARYFGWEKLEEGQQFPIKGHSLDARQLLGGDRANPFMGGPVLLVRLAPVDYHHVHYPDDGTTLEDDRMGYRLWTVNRNALQSQPDILLRNERHINILQSQNFGRLGFIEVGALSVGRIVQVHPIDKPFKRGEQKSVFRFGGSAIVVFGEPGAWRPADDILEKTKAGTETLLRLGEPAAKRLGAPAK